jgi:hypothetical protein
MSVVQWISPRVVQVSSCRGEGGMSSVLRCHGVAGVHCGFRPGVCVSRVFCLYNIDSPFQWCSSVVLERWRLVVAVGGWAVGLTMLRLLMAVDRDTKCHMQGERHMSFMQELLQQHERCSDSERQISTWIDRTQLLSLLDYSHCFD